MSADRWKLPALKDPLWKNPVIVKEVRTRMRGNRAFILVTAHLVILGLVLALAYLVFRSSLNTGSSLEERRLFSKAIFGLIVWIELILISFTAPALTSGAISSEHERQTYDLLRVTLLPARALVLGKYLSGLVFLLLLVFTAIPLLSPAFLVGGVLASEILGALSILLVSAVAFCAIGLFFSCLVRRTLLATVVSYAFAIFLVFGIPMMAMILLILLSSSMIDTPDRFSLPVQALLILAGWLLLSVTPLGAIIASEAILIDQNSILRYALPLDQGALKLTLILPSPWILYVIIYLLVSLVLLWLSIRLVQRVER